jgi:hypothetical protein
MRADILKDVDGSGIDLILSHMNNVLTVTFSKPISFASLKIHGNTHTVTLKALDKSNNVVDVDVNSSEFEVFGQNIVTLVLVEVNDNIDELSFIPQ